MTNQKQATSATLTLQHLRDARVAIEKAEARDRTIERVICGGCQTVFSERRGKIAYRFVRFEAGIFAACDDCLFERLG